MTLASTKNSVHILQYHKGQEQSTQSDFWMDAGKKSDIRFEDIIAWAELPQPFFLFSVLANRPQLVTHKSAMRSRHEICKKLIRENLFR
jgi:hypothetical protein